MKKTIIAAAVAATVAAPAAFADVSISGQFNQELYSINGGDLGGDRNADLTFKASEDLGNGMKAFMTMSIVDDAASSGGTGTTGDTGMASSSTQIVGISGDFGTLTMGKQEAWIESAAAAMAANDASDRLSNEVATSVGATGEGTIEYVSPSMNGVKVVLTAIADAAGDDLDTTSIGVEYANGPLLVRFASADDNGVDTDVIAASYSINGFNLKAANADENGASETWYGVDYTMGANTFAASTNTNTKVDIFSVKHAMSKNVAVYAAMQNGATTATDETLVGMQVKF
jgi:hypothetical protein